MIHAVSTLPRRALMSSVAAAAFVSTRSPAKARGTIDHPR